MLFQFASLGTVVTQFGGYLTLAGVFLGGLVYLFSTARHGRQDVIRQDNSDLRASNEGLRVEKIAHEATIKEARETILNLRDIATQTPAVTKLIEMNTRQQKQTNDQHRQVITELSKLTGKISDLASQFGVLAKALNESNRREANNVKR